MKPLQRTIPGATTHVKYHILVPLPVEEQSVRRSSSSAEPQSVLHQLPIPLRFLLCACALNFLWIVCFSSHHFDAQQDSVLLLDQRVLPTAAQGRPSRSALLKPATTDIHGASARYGASIKNQIDTQSTSDNKINEANVLVVIISDRIAGIIPTVSSILTHTTSKPVDLVLIGNDRAVNEQVREHFSVPTATRRAVHHFTSLTVQDVQADLLAQGYRPIWTWSEWGSSRQPGWRNNKHTLHVADWDSLETHAHELNHLRFYLPLVSQFRKHRYLYFLDDDILVQKDLGYTADETLQTLDTSRGLVTPCNIWIWDSKCHHFGFENEASIKPILQMPSLYGDRNVCQSDAESHCYPPTYPAFLESVLPVSNDTTRNKPRDQKAWNFGFSLFALDNWRALDLTSRYEAVMKESYRLHVFPETSLTFGLGVSYLAFAGAVECWNDQAMKVRDGFGFIEWNRYEHTFGANFLEKQVDVLHYTGPHKPWVANTTIEPRSLEPWLQYMRREGMVMPDQLPATPGQKLFTLLASDRTGAQWIMSALDSHPAVCASGEGEKPESGFPVDVLYPQGTPWFPVCSVKLGCSLAFVRDAVFDLAQGMDRRGRTGRIPTRCRLDHRNSTIDALGIHLPRMCNFLQALRGNYTNGAIETVWVDAFRREDQTLLGCSCPRGTAVKGLKVLAEWISYRNSPHEKTGPLDLILDNSALSGSKIIRLKRRNLWARYMSAVLAQKSNMFHVTTPGDKKTQISSTSNLTISIEDMFLKMLSMEANDVAADKWAKQHGSDVLDVDYEECRDDTPACFKRIFDFLEVDSSFASKHRSRFASVFASLHTDSSLDPVKNRGPVQEALAVNGYGKFVGISNHTQVQLLVYDDEETLERTHQFHQQKGINATMFGRLVGLIKQPKYAAAAQLLRNMSPDTVVVLSESRDVRVQFPAGSDFLRYEAIYDFREALADMTRDFPGAVIASTETHCCSSALTHAQPGDFYKEDGRRKRRSCESGKPGCEWAGNEKSRPWQKFMRDLASQRSHNSIANIYLDASLLGGKASDLLRFIEATNIGEGEDDRAVLTDYMFHNPNMLLLDYEMRLFGKNREGLHREVNSACPFGSSVLMNDRKLELPRPTLSLFMHAPMELGCIAGNHTVESPIFPRWDDGGIQIGPILDHLHRVAEEKATIVLPPELGGKPDYHQGPEVPYFPDESGVWTSKLIRDRTDDATLKWRTEPTEAVIYRAHHILKANGDETSYRWSSLRGTLQTGGFPYWAWYGDFKTCNFHNYGNESIPLFTPSAMANCDHAFPVPNYMNIIDSQPTTDNWRGLFRDTKVNYPWESKIRKVVWRGSLSEASGNKALTSVRWRASTLIYKLNSELYDVGLTSIPPWVSDQIAVNVSEVGGLKEGISPMAAFQHYVAVLDMDGNSWSSRFATLLCYNSVVIKVEPKYVEYFYGTLEPWTHYIPVKDDLSDLHENVAWALDARNERTVQDIITTANEWCAQRLVPEELAHDLLDTWESYVLHLTRADPDWQQEWLKKVYDSCCDFEF